MPVHDQRADAAPRELIGEHQPGRARAHDQYIRIHTISFHRTLKMTEGIAVHKLPRDERLRARPPRFPRVVRVPPAPNPASFSFSERSKLFEVKPSGNWYERHEGRVARYIRGIGACCAARLAANNQYRTDFTPADRAQE